MKRSANTRRTAGNSSLVGLAKVMARLTPRQLTDELGLATAEMKQKGIKAGIAAAFMVVALLFIAGLAVALVVAAILGLGTVMPDWLAALLVALLFLIIAAVGGLIGYSRFKKTLPLLPEEAIYGLRYDLGVLKEGRSFDPATLEKKPAEPKDKDKDKKDKDKDKKKDSNEDGPKPATPEELRTRTRQRREHMAAVRDGLAEKVDVKDQIRELKARRAAQHRSSDSNGQGAESSSSDEIMALIKERWQPLTVLAASLLAMVIMMRRISQK
ncbi:phage holin family protein [Arthrobacter gengyunqii]|uniref:Phage holin family protein n=1 Tax=Arthrobacter gengyunqii TaxID=2886940 RepID=A0A9X1M1W1_9MICC|nr:phage holin family protein [Arthrobacter gengyunqii]MCC3269754.1 phage holin family protein [Arthrobacter gengyunqii]UOY97209.1 phage holin family protein [Arthrobacter gengyunqii]